MNAAKVFALSKQRTLLAYPRLNHRLDTISFLLAHVLQCLQSLDPGTQRAMFSIGRQPTRWLHCHTEPRQQRGVGSVGRVARNSRAAARRRSAWISAP